MSSKALTLLAIVQLLYSQALFSQPNARLRANLYAFSTEGTPELYDGNLTMYDVTYSNAVDSKDAVKMSNFGENFGLLRGTTTLVIERRASITGADTTFFKLWNMRNTDYQLELWLTGLDHPGLSGILEDSYLNTRTNLHLNGGNTYAFSITGVPASSAPDRFKVIFSSSALRSTNLPMVFTEARSYKKKDQVNVEWVVENQKNLAQHPVGQPVKGRQPGTTSTMTRNQKGNAQNSYNEPVLSSRGNLSGISNNEKSRNAGFAGSRSIVVFPNPVSNGMINFHLNSSEKGSYTARIVNYQGQVIQIVKLQHTGGNIVRSIRLRAGMPKGNYWLEIISPGKNKLNANLFLQ